jgi:hypothetical protein
MRPTIAEQLRETRRILNDMLLPRLDDDYAAQILVKALANLEMLEMAWSNVLPYLHWDNDTALALLNDMRTEVGAELAAAIDKAARGPLCAPFDANALQARNEALQALVHRVIGECGPDGRRRIHAHLMERTMRYPMRPGATSFSNARSTKDN